MESHKTRIIKIWQKKNTTIHRRCGVYGKCPVFSTLDGMEIHLWTRCSLCLSSKQFVHHIQRNLLTFLAWNWPHFLIANSFNIQTNFENDCNSTSKLVNGSYQRLCIGCVKLGNIWLFKNVFYWLAFFFKFGEKRISVRPIRAVMAA